MQRLVKNGHFIKENGHFLAFLVFSIKVHIKMNK